ncbi:MAG TPA: hypothetical protein VIK04_04295 [Solirubrobacteraceae bacterium]
MSGTDRHPLDAAAILGALVAGGVDFVVIGGIAAVLHGSAQATFDLDICFSSERPNLRSLGAVLVGLGARLRGAEDAAEFVPDARTLRRVEVLTMVTDAGELDVLARPAGSPGYPALRHHADEFELNGLTVPVACIEDLITMKRAAGRPKDLAAVAELEAIRELRREGPR